MSGPEQPVGWADVATKRDVDRLEVATDRLEATMRRELVYLAGELKAELKAEVRAEIISAQRHMAMWVTGLNAALVALVFTAVKLG